MHRSVEQQIPKFIEDYLLYCDCFTDINKQTTCWVLTRNLKFFEFYRKQLVASIDLYATCLRKLKNNVQNYDGHKSKWCNASGVPLSVTETTQHHISLGKYVFNAINIHKIYVIIQCWDKCVVLKRMPDFKGFEITAEFEAIQSYRITNGTIKYCPVLELTLRNGRILKTDFEDKLDASHEESSNKKRLKMHALEQIRCARAELQLHKSITAQSFHSVQNNLTLGESILRTSRIEEKQILCRCGDIWTRFTAHDDLVVGVPLVNQCSPPNLSIIRNLAPVFQTEQSQENAIQLHYRLFQLNLKFDQLDELELLLECDDEQLQEKIWCSNGDLTLLPESFAVLLIKLKISQVIYFKKASLILNYEVIKHLHLTKFETINSSFTMPLQLYLKNLDFHRLLFEERTHSEIKFLPLTLHQDFLTIYMTATETSLKITFENCKALNIFENYIQKSLEFLKPTLRLNSRMDANKYSTVFYNKNPSSLLFGSLILRMKEINYDDGNLCETRWKFYCQNFDKTLFLVKNFINEQLTLKCNIINISNDRINFKSTEKFKNALRQELEHLQEIVRDANENKQEKIKNLEKLYQLQMNSDILADDVIEK